MPSTTHVYSTTYNEFLLNEGIDIFQAKWVKADVYNFGCIACSACFNEIQDKRSQYNKGVLLSITDLNDAKAFKKKPLLSNT